MVRHQDPWTFPPTPPSFYQSPDLPEFRSYWRLFQARAWSSKLNRCSHKANTIVRCPSSVSGRRWGRIDGWEKERNRLRRGWWDSRNAREVDGQTEREWKWNIVFFVCFLKCFTDDREDEDTTGQVVGVDKTHGPTQLCFCLLFYSTVLCRTLISQVPLLWNTHTHLKTIGPVELSYTGQAAKEDKVVSMLCSSYLCWRRHAAWAPC